MIPEPKLKGLYQEVILDHNRRPRNFTELKDATQYSHGKNP
ncbi:MAG: SUF system NifU family Fe-S cluster assembly protein, partial [Candidatus Omnitrophica bacterium]|nr:SUF system NifU family Fe-S cluster assembly protein [Candidatus Omnitrophota bacterium]